MGDLRSDNGGVPPDDGSHQGHLPGFPPEWGSVVIPDDASELDLEAVAIRREMRRESRQARLRSAFGVSPPTEAQAPSLGVPVVIMAVAVLTTLVSLFVVTWGRQPGQPEPVTSLSSGWQGVTSGATSLSDTVLPDSTGGPVRLGSLLPAVILLMDGCDCTTVVLDVAAAAPAGVTVVRVGPTAPGITSAPANVRSLADPDGVLRSRYAADTNKDADVTRPAETGPDRTTESAKPTAILLDTSGFVTSTIGGFGSADDLGPDLRRLV